MPDNQTALDMYWADLIMGLLYAGSLVLFLAWVGNIQLPATPAPLSNIVGNGWTWMISAAASAIISLIFVRRLSKAVLAWTVILTVLLCIALCFLRVSYAPPTPPIASETWQSTENLLPIETWSAQFNGNAFSCRPKPDYSPQTLCKAFASGNFRAVHRFQAPNDGNECIFFGELSGSTIEGTYNCTKNGGPFKWTATVVSRELAH